MFSRMLFVLFLYIHFSVSLTAQWSAGISGGANLSFLNHQIKNSIVTYDFDHKTNLGWNVAAGVEWAANPVLGIRAEGGLQQWRTHLDIIFTDGSGGEAPGTLYERYHSVAGAVLAKITPLRQKNVYFVAGPSVAYVLNGRQKTRVERATYHETRHIDLNTNMINRMQYFTDFGAGFQANFGARGKVHLEARYQLALQEFSAIPNVDSHRNNLLIRAGYSYTF